MVIKAAEPSFLEYYNDCNVNNCHGKCFQSLCTCPVGLYGRGCDQSLIGRLDGCNGSTSSNRSIFLEVDEMMPLSYLITPNVSFVGYV